MSLHWCTPASPRSPPHTPGGARPALRALFSPGPGPMSQVSGQCPSLCDAPHGVPSAALDPAQTMSLLPGLEVAAGSTLPTEASSEKGSPEEEVVTSMPQDSGPGAHQALNSTDLDVPTEAVTCQPQGNPLGCTPLLPNGSSHRHPSEPGSARHVGNGAPGGSKAPRKLQTHPSLSSQAGRKSKGSTRSASQVPLQAQEDCCVHCILSCLFCEFLTLCNIVLDCATCGSCSSEDSCLCCCCCGSGECVDCDLPCDLDCGIVDACCESADCLEICMECCALCFSS